MDRNTQITLERARDAFLNVLEYDKNLVADNDYIDQTLIKEVEAALKGINGALEEVNKPKPDFKMPEPDPLPEGLPIKWIALECDKAGDVEVRQVSAYEDLFLYKHASNDPFTAMLVAFEEQMGKLTEAKKQQDNALAYIKSLHQMQYTLARISKKLGL